MPLNGHSTGSCNHIGAAFVAAIFFSSAGKNLRMIPPETPRHTRKVKPRTYFFAILSKSMFFFPRWPSAAIALALLFIPITLCAQITPRTIHFRLLNGKNGRPIGNQSVILTTFGREGKYLGTKEVHLAKDGTGVIDFPSEAAKFELSGYEDDYLHDCGARQGSLMIEQILRSGYVAGNTCGSRATIARAGEIVLWGDPASKFRRLFPVCSTDTRILLVALAFVNRAV